MRNLSFFGIQRRKIPRSARDDKWRGFFLETVQPLKYKTRSCYTGFSAEALLRRHSSSGQSMRVNAKPTSA
jgi:hypothetical protein